MLLYLYRFQEENFVSCVSLYVLAFSRVNQIITIIKWKPIE